MEDQPNQTTPGSTPTTGPVMDVKPADTGVPNPNDVSMSPENESAPAPMTNEPVSPAPQPMSSEPSSFHPPVTAPMSKKSGKMGKVLLILIIAIVLAAAAVYFYTKNNETTSTTPVATTKTTTAAKASDVNQTISAIDSTIKKTDSNGDVSSGDLSNSTLGL